MSKIINDVMGVFMISITTATADDLITLADIEQICFSSQESASLNTFKIQI